METISSVTIPADNLPVTVTSVYVSPQQEVKQGERVLSYKYTFEQLEEDSDDEGDGRAHRKRKVTRIHERILDLSSPYDGTVQQVLVRPGDTLKVAGTAVARIIEPCSHAVQLKGVCALCGKDLTVANYEGSHVNRATINMSYDGSGLMVSRTEAERIEKENAERLIKEKRLSLIVDLDQTIIQATWDTSVEQWMSDPNNPNHAATKDVRKFSLPANPDIMYYIKPRPTLATFLAEINKLYELHIYTMGTRSYAEAVAREIDPEGRYFEKRIVSRDDSGSITQKSIQRLFPCDQSMVVIIDDRSDIWNWSPNLIEVQPYDFFLGSGDINSAFLPKKDSTSKRPREDSDPSKPMANGNNDAVGANNSMKKEKQESKASEEEEDQSNAMDEDTPPDSQTLAKQEKEQNEMAEHMSKDQPLLQKQKEAGTHSGPILKDDDRELERLLAVLKSVHKKFYDAYDAQQTSSSENLPEEFRAPDVKVLIPQLKRKILEGTNILFSSVIPLGQEQRSADIWRLARQFGAECSLKLTRQVTHVVAGKNGTQKVNGARRMKGVVIVRPEWLYDSISKWERQDEKNYLLEPRSGHPNGEGGHEDEDLRDPNDNLFAADVEEALDEAFADNKENEDEPLSISEEEMNKHWKATDWTEADREVEELMAESGTDWDDGTSDAASDFGGDDSDEERFGTKRKLEDDEEEADEEEEITADTPRSRLAKRLKGLQNRRSGLSQSVTADDAEDDDDATDANGKGIPERGLDRRKDQPHDSDRSHGKASDDEEDDDFLSEMANDSRNMCYGIEVVAWDCLLLVGVILLVVWILGLVGIYTIPTGGLFHIFIALAIIFIIAWLFVRCCYGRRSVRRAYV
ncbi:hypothetical protein BZG36_02785 [Bifiguratus adelaidae]|uniref:RNA polymerase II subunit A C-terminal domain phosphatase n=1 Tax=Bifiguratus adelaidae TaxID=1938954 RepID=A0A261Y1H6_9FUNG|nr:hypothetical protein BZG36_02785 [Bifiguratus adelaidae]